MKYTSIIESIDSPVADNRCFTEDCYCRPFNNPLEIRHTFNIETIRKYTGNQNIFQYDLKSIAIFDIGSSAGTVLTGSYLSIYRFDNDLAFNGTLFIQIFEQLPKECFTLGFSFDVYDANMNLINSPVLFTEPYCQVGESCIQFIYGYYDLSVHGPLENMVATFSNGTTERIFNYKKLSNIAIYNATPNADIFAYYDTGFSDGATITHLNGVALVYSVLSCRTAKQCGRYFRITADRVKGIDCNDNLYINKPVGWGPFVTRYFISENVYTILGSAQRGANTVKKLVAGETCHVVGNTSQKSLQLYSSNNANIAMWALNEIGTMLTSKNLQVISNNKEINKDDKFILEDDNYWVRPVDRSNNKYLSVGLVSCECNRYFVC